ncbi:MAG TPA: VWA domain-containing protein [Candidatus Thermoplasmatota archaeon]|nr:VWA domain-containing protein [Candidatus Thermoplasmatota archaeon]
MTDVTLPDCSVHREPLHLTAEERRELVIRIAKEGPAALDRFIAEKERESGGRVAEALRRLRDSLLKQAAAMKARLETSYRSERESLERAYNEELAALEARRREEAARLERERGSHEERLREELARAELARLVLSAPPKERMTLGQRVFAWVMKALRALWWLLTLPFRLIAWLFGVRRPRVRGRTAAVPVRGGSGVLMEVEAGLGTALLTSPDLRRAVDSRLRTLPTKERLRAFRNRLLGLENYEDVARRLMQEALAEEAARRERELTEREHEMARRLNDLTEAEEARRLAREQSLAELERRQEEAVRALERRAREDPVAEVKDRLLADLEGAGLLTRKNGELAATSRLVERFADIVFAEESRGLAAGRGGRSGSYADGTGLFVREPMRSTQDLSHMDTHGTLLRARLRHPHQRHIYDDDVVVYREERGTRLHVVLIVDRSLSMEENNRMLAAKRAALALWHAVKRDNPRNLVDIVAMDTGVERVGLKEMWETKPRGFTNHGRALREAAALIQAGKAERALVYLVTDGLPEAYTVNGVDGAGHPDRAMKYALEEARKLTALPSLQATTLILLEAEDELFVKNAEKLAKTLEARVVKTDPRALAKDVLAAFDSAPVERAGTS